MSVTRLLTIRLEIICRPVKLSPRLRRFTTGWCTDWVTFWVRWVTDLRSTGDKITPTTGKERGDLELKDYAVLQKPQEQTDRLPHPRTLILDFTLTHTRFGRSHVHSIGQLTHTSRSDGASEKN